MLLVIVVAASVAVLLGAQAVRERELPLVTLEAAPVAAASPSGVLSKPGTIEVTITARGAGMKTDNDLLVQVIGVRQDPAPAPTGSPSPTTAPPVDPIPQEVVAHL
jgi:hypothetical protein